MTRTIALAVALLAACSDDGGTVNPEGGPALGYWAVSVDEPRTGWNCNAIPSNGSCVPPEPFAPLPTELHLTRDAIEWTDGAVHDGAASGICFNISGAQEHGHARGAYTFCNAVMQHDGMTDVLPDLAYVQIRWDADAPGDCLCGAYFDYVGP